MTDKFPVSRAADKLPMENKSKQVLDTIEKLFPGTMQEIAEDTCPLCKLSVGHFRDEHSLKEYYISGMCQNCQDDIFGKDQ